jgi:hypothetical protein
MAALKVGGRQVTVMIITPALAKTWLANYNHGNRPIKPTTVAKYARAMKASRWRPGVGMIQFAEDGRLINGQHTLSAIVASGVSQEMIVTRGARSEDQDVMDDNDPRRAGQQLGMKGWKSGSTVAAITRMIVRWQTDTLDTKATSLSVDEVVQFADRYRVRMEASTALALALYARVPIKPAISGAFAFTAYDLAAAQPEKLSPAVVDEFFHALTSGANLPEGSPMLALRAQAQRMRDSRDRGARMSLPDSVALYYVTRSWRGWRKSETLGKLQLPKGSTVTLADLRLI